MAGEWMEREIDEQPDLLSRLAPEYAARLGELLKGREFDMVLLVARGSSDHAALYARYLIEVHLGIPAVLAAPSVITRYHSRVRYPSTLAVGISQSGSAPDVSDVLGSMREDGHTTLAITNTKDSRLSRVAEHTLYLKVGEERSVAATKTYTASLLALYELVRSLGGELASSKTPDGAWLQSCRESACRDAAILSLSSPTFALGRGYAFATACETALKLMECALLPCKAYSSADFEHGPKALAGEGSAIVAFSDPGGCVRAQGGAVIDAPLPGVNEEVAPLWQALYGQCLALRCARIRGEDPDNPQFIKKVTRTH